MVKIENFHEANNKEGRRVLGALLLILAPLFIFVALPQVLYSQDQIGGQAGALEVVATIKPYLAVSVYIVDGGEIGEKPTPSPLGFKSTSRSNVINFSGLEKPGVIAPDKHVLIRASSNTSNWSIVCTTTGLQSEDDFIPPERLFVHSPYSGGKDEGAGAGFENLGSPRLVATGKVASQIENEVFLKLELTWDDKPGSYDGVVNFEILPVP